MRLKVKNKRISGVYKITNPSGDSYIGQSFDVVRRFRNHIWILIDKKKNENLSKEILNDFAINFVQYLREKDVVSISQKQINLLTNGKSIKSFSEHLTDFNNRHNEKSKNSQK